MISLTIAPFSRYLWTVIEAPMANHLWQSTLVAGVAELLVLVLRKNQARTRYWLWLSASIKFLFPFSLLVSLGSYLSWSRITAIGRIEFSSVVQQIGRPFPATASTRTVVPNVTLVGILPAVLFFVWLLGVVSVMFFLWRRWRRVTAAMRGISPVTFGRELELLRRLERSQGFAGSIDLVISESSLEPGIAGVFHPVMLLPAGISDRLSDAQLEAILAHELCHVRRRDNLAATVHMLVEALFWFHPLVWWIGARLVDERESGCDQEVLRQGGDPQVYAESILKVCEFYLESPLFCAAGVTGSNLKRRIEAIMNHRIARKLEFGKKLLLTAMGTAAVVAPILVGLLHPMTSHAESQIAVRNAFVFEDVSITPNKSNGMVRTVRMLYTSDEFTATNVTLGALIKEAYGVESYQILGGPTWLDSATYDIEAKVNSSVASELGKLSEAQRKAEQQYSLQAFLAEHFKLTLHSESKELPIYSLGIVESGAKLQEAKSGDTYANGFKGPGGHTGTGAMMIRLGGGRVAGQAVSLSDLVHQLSGQLGSIVRDKTGLTGKYDFTLEWTPDGTTNSLSTALKEQLGLELNKITASIETLVIDHVEKIQNAE